MSFSLMVPAELEIQIAKRAQAKRLALNLTQKSLSHHSGVSFGVIKKFERTGKISLESLLKIALVLEALPEFAELFKPFPVERFSSIDELLSEKKRQRGRL